MVPLQCCVIFYCMAKWISYFIHIPPLFKISFPIWGMAKPIQYCKVKKNNNNKISFPFRSPQSIKHSSLCYTVDVPNLILMFLLHIPVRFSCSVMSNSFWPHGLRHTRLPCPSPTPRACSNSCPSSQWCHPTISSSIVPFSSCLQSFSASRSFPVS